jgi:hypothetical protein
MRVDAEEPVPHGRPGAERCQGRGHGLLPESIHHRGRRAGPVPRDGGLRGDGQHAQGRGHRRARGGTPVDIGS